MRRTKDQCIASDFCRMKQRCYVGLSITVWAQCTIAINGCLQLFVNLLHFAALIVAYVGMLFCRHQEVEVCMKNIAKLCRRIVELRVYQGILSANHYLCTEGRQGK
jgi:uncharacterized membrane protein